MEQRLQPPRSPRRGRTYPRTTAGRKAKSVLVFGGEQDSSGFNQLQATQSSFWAVVEGNTAVIRGAYLIDDKGQYHLDLASNVTATKSTLTITIRPDAYWNWGGKKSPVTNADVGVHLAADRRSEQPGGVDDRLRPDRGLHA